MKLVKVKELGDLGVGRAAGREGKIIQLSH